MNNNKYLSIFSRKYKNNYRAIVNLQWVKRLAII